MFAHKYYLESVKTSLCKIHKVQIFKRFTFHTASISIFKHLKIKLHFKYVLLLLAHTLTLHMPNLPPSLSHICQKTGVSADICRSTFLSHMSWNRSPFGDPLFTLLCLFLLPYHPDTQKLLWIDQLYYRPIFPSVKNMLVALRTCLLLSKTCLLLNYKPTVWSSTFPADVLTKKSWQIIQNSWMDFCTVKLRSVKQSWQNLQLSYHISFPATGWFFSLVPPPYRF